MIAIAGFVLLAAAGALARSELARLGNRAGRIPWGTLTANLVASAGVALVARHGSAWLTVVGTGGLGALSTFSTVAAELSELARRHRGRAVAYLGLTLAGTVGLVVVLGP